MHSNKISTKSPDDAFAEMERKTALLISRLHPPLPQTPQTPASQSTHAQVQLTSQQTVSTEPPQTPQIIFPTGFQDFWQDLIFFKKTPTIMLTGNILDMSLPSGKTCQISTDAIISILSDKYNSPIPKTQISSIPVYPNFDEIERVLVEKKYWFENSYNQILTINERILLQSARQYHTDQSYLLECRIRFLEYEKSLNYIKIQKAIDAGLEKKEEEVRSIQKDYQSKIEKERTEFRTKLDSYKIEIDRLRTIANHLKDNTDSFKSKLDAANEEVDKTRQKVSDLESKSESLERTLSDTKSKLMRAESELRKYKSSEWSLSISSTPDKPVFISDNDDEGSRRIVEFPALSDFKENFKATGMEGDIIIYKAGNRKVEVPVSLEAQYPKLIEKLIEPHKNNTPPEPKTPKEPKEKKVKEKPLSKKLASNPIKVLEALKKALDGLTLQEASAASGIDYKHISECMFKLENAKQVEERESVTGDGRKIAKYYVVV